MKTLVILSTAVLAVACTKPNPTPMPSPPPPPEPTALETLLKDLEPAAQTPLTSFAPDWWLQATAVLTVTPDQMSEIIVKEPALKLGSADMNHFDHGMRFLTAVTYLERAREAHTCEPACVLGLAHVYHVFALWSFMDPEAAVDRAITVAGVELTRESAERASAPSSSGSSANRHNAFAESLSSIERRFPDSPEAVTALRDVAIVETRAGNLAISRPRQCRSAHQARQQRCVRRFLESPPITRFAPVVSSAVTIL